MSDIADIKRAIARLEASATRITRRNARLQLQRIIARIMERYPAMRPDGTEIIPVKRRGLQCPVCKVPMKSAATLVRHLRMKCRMVRTAKGWTPEKPRYVCACGKECNTRGIEQHLRAVSKQPGGLGDHFAAAILTGTAAAPGPTTFVGGTP